MVSEAAMTAAPSAAVSPHVAPSWDILQSRYSDDASDQSDDDSASGDRSLMEAHSNDGEESEDEDDALERLIWADIHDGMWCISDLIQIRDIDRIRSQLPPALHQHVDP